MRYKSLYLQASPHSLRLHQYFGHTEGNRLLAGKALMRRIRQNRTITSVIVMSRSITRYDIDADHHIRQGLVTANAWELVNTTDGTVIDTDQNRHDLLQRNNLQIPGYFDPDQPITNGLQFANRNQAA